MHLIDSLKNALVDKEVILVYTDKKNPENFSAGIPLFLMKEWLALKSINPDGFDDGFLLKRIEDVYKIESDDKYKRRLEKLFSFRKNQIQACELTKCENLKELLISVKDKVISAINYEGDNVTGKILDVQDDFFEIQSYDFYGEVEDKIKVNYEVVSSLSIDGLEEQNLSILLQS